jgi:hypothetical protein
LEEEEEWFMRFVRVLLAISTNKTLPEGSLFYGATGFDYLRLNPQVANAYFSVFAKVFNFSSFKEN